MLMGIAVIGFISFHTDIPTIGMCRLIVASQIEDLVTRLLRKRKQQVSIKTHHVPAKLRDSTSTNTPHKKDINFSTIINISYANRIAVVSLVMPSVRFPELEDSGLVGFDAFSLGWCLPVLFKNVVLLKHG
jgi:hypothetical protein